MPLVLILILDPLYLNVPGADNETVRTGLRWSEAYKQPLDLVLCPTLQWGCRYLTIDHRTLVGHVWKPEAIADLRAGKGEPQGIIDALFGKKVGVKDMLAAIEGVVLRGRSLRFAKFDESRLYAADMITSYLSRATFEFAQLQGANLLGADLTGANLFEANLSFADLSHADLFDSNLGGADLSDARLSEASLGGADLSRASLGGAHLSDARLFEANLSDANLSDADLSDADLSRANLSRADLSFADLRRARLLNANLSRANLTDANLSDAELRLAVNLTQAQLDQACGTDANLPAGLTLKLCPDKPVAPPLNPGTTP